MSEGRALAAVAAGGAVGSLGRWLVSLAAGGAVWGTLLVNVTGALALGLVIARLEHGEHHPLVRPLAAVGLLGGWTTYSTFVLDGHTLAGDALPPLLGQVSTARRADQARHEVRTRDLQGDLRALLDWAAGHRLELAGLDARAASLEQIFLDISGHPATDSQEQAA